MYGDRYRYDSGQCSPRQGWVQYDTSQDAWYFGIWVHPERREILSYCEGDETLVTCPTQEIFAAELAEMATFYGPPPPAAIGVDADGTTTYYYDTDSAFGREIEGLTKKDGD